MQVSKADLFCTEQGEDTLWPPSLLFMEKSIGKGLNYAENVKDSKLTGKCEGMSTVSSFPV